MRIRTIAIIGAGPAGATAAEKLARGRKQGALQQQPAGIASVLGSSICNPVLHSAQTSPRPGGASDPEIDANTRVLVFEENPGWEKPCGGGLPYKALRRYPFLLDALAPHTCMREAELFAGDGNSAALRLHHPLAIYSRAELNRLVVRRAEEAGAELVKDRILDFRRLNGEWKIQGRQNIYMAD